MSPPYLTTARGHASDGEYSCNVGAAFEVMPVEQQPRRTFRRNPFEILGECFSIYGRHFRKFIVIALIIQLPMTAVETSIADSLPTLEGFQSLQGSNVGEDAGAGSPPPQTGDIPESSSLDGFPIGEFVNMMRTFLPYLAFASIASTILNGAFAFAVAQQYAAGTVSVGMSFGRAWWRVLSLVALGFIIFAAITLMLAGALFIVPAIVIMVALVYWSVATQAVIIEGCKPIESMRRSWELVRSNWWRTFGAWVLVGLVTLGFVVLLSLLLMAPLNLIRESGDFLRGAAGMASSIVTGAIITPILGIAGALIYFDLRSEKEDYNLDALAEQLGITPGSDDYGLDAQ